MSVNAHEWAESSEFEPAGEEFLVCGVAGVASVETADITGPPGDSCDSNGLSGSDLRVEGLPGGADISTPHSSAVFCLSCPSTAAQGQEFIFALFVHAFPDHAGVFARVEVRDVQTLSRIKTQVGGVTGIEFGLAGIEPEHAHAQIEVVVLELAPHVVACCRVRRVVEGDGKRAIHSFIAEGLVVFNSGLGADQ